MFRPTTARPIQFLATAPLGVVGNVRPRLATALSGSRSKTVSCCCDCRSRRTVSTWSPLAATFNAKPSVQSALNFGPTTGLFGIDVLRHPTGFHLLKERVVAATDRLVAESCSPRRTRRMVSIFDELSDTLCQVADLAEFIRIAHPEPGYVMAAQDASMEINALVERLNTNQELYNALKKVVEHGDIVPTDDVDRHVAKLFLFDFEQSGIHLDEAKRLQAVELNEFILETGSMFMRSTSSARAVDAQNVPESIRSCFERRGDSLIVSSLCAESSMEMVREVAYKVYMHPVEQQEQRLRDLLVARAQLARLCGFPTFAHRVLRGSLAATPHVVTSFLDTLTERLRPYARADFDEMEAVKRMINPHAKDVRLWDVPYLSSQIRSDRVDMNPSDVMPYLSLGACMDGLNLLFERLYDVTLQPEKAIPTELWSSDVHKLAVVHKQEGILGYIYCDFIGRQGKPNQDCHFTIRGGRELTDGSYQLPLVVLLLNLPSSTWTSPCLLTPGMVENLFHEMGHAMHSMLARTKYQHVTGTRCSTDFAEVPSILMEYFASDPRVLGSFARHYRTGERIPDNLLSQLSLGKSVLCASEMQLQIFYAMLDQRYHGNLQQLGLGGGDGQQTNNATTTDVLAQVQTKYYGLPYVPQTAWQLRFGHLVGYGAKYYSYLMSKAVASWIWQRHFQADPFSRESGISYRQEILAHGGGRPPQELLEGYLKEKLTPEKLVDFLIAEIDRKTSEVNGTASEEF